VSLHILLGLTCIYLFMVFGDCVTTYLCLTTPNEAYQVWEGNLLSAWLFTQVGLVQGLALASGAKVLALVWLYRLVRHRPELAKLACLGLAVATSTALWATLNNWYIWSVIRS
jgi:hypothetical protein